MFEYAASGRRFQTKHWLALFARYLLQRYRSDSAFVIDSQGSRSQQVDPPFSTISTRPRSSPTKLVFMSPPKVSTPCSKSSRSSPRRRFVKPWKKPRPSAPSRALPSPPKGAVCYGRITAAKQQLQRDRAASGKGL